MGCGCNCHTAEDIESGQQEHTSDSEKEMSMYEKHNRRPTGYCRVETIDEDNLQSLPSSSDPVENEVEDKNTGKEIFKEEDMTSPYDHQSTPATVVVEVENEVMECESITKGTNEKQAFVSLPPMPPPLPTIMTIKKDSPRKTAKKVRFQSGIDVDKQRKQRRNSETIKVIRTLSSSIRRPSLLDQIEIAQEVIMHNRKNDNQVC